MRKRILSLLMALCLVVGMVPAISAAEIASGTCGENLTWVLTEDGTLTISGEGEMQSFSDYEEWWGDGFHTIRINAPWCDYEESITSVIVNEGVTSIGDEAFEFCQKLIKVELPTSLLTIGKNAFTASRNLNSINLPDGLQSIGEGAFSECDSLHNITLPGSLVEWEDIFTFSGLKTVTICDGVSEIPKDAFVHCGMLEQITIPPSIKTIGQAAFSYCTNLVEIELPYGVETILDSAFLCSNLTTIVLPDTLKTIGDYTFSGCNMLESITIPSSVTQIGSNALNSSSLKAIHVDEGNQYFSSDSIGVLYNKDKTVLIHFPGGLRGYYAIPEGVTTLGNHAFSYRYLSALSIPVSVTAFGSSTFFFNYNGFSIKDIYYGGSPEQWKLIECAYYDSGYNDGLDESRIHYNSTNPDEHPYIPSILAPTCTVQGCTTYTCSCGHSYVSDYVDPLGHNYADGTCTRCGEEDPDYVSAENPFTDVTASDFYYTSVLWALENNITSGTAADEFSPYEACLRSQVVTFLWRAAGKPAPTSQVNPFEDVKPTDYYYNAVLWAVEKGITFGADDTHFEPNGVCSRSQVVSFLYRAFEKPPVEGTDNPFTDVPAGAWYANPVRWAVKEGIAYGLSESEFGPNEVCNRSQVVTFLYRAYN